MGADDVEAAGGVRACVAALSSGRALSAERVLEIQHRFAVVRKVQKTHRQLRLMGMTLASAWARWCDATRAARATSPSAANAVRDLVEPGPTNTRTRAGPSDRKKAASPATRGTSR